ncbi:hypothetical protein GCM10028795_13590 [Lysobacter olei]
MGKVVRLAGHDHQVERCVQRVAGDGLRLCQVDVAKFAAHAQSLLRKFGSAGFPHEERDITTSRCHPSAEIATYTARAHHQDSHRPIVHFIGVIHGTGDAVGTPQRERRCMDNEPQKIGPGNAGPKFFAFNQD